VKGENNMYNNLTQQTPYMYGYGMQPQYQRMMQQQTETAPMPTQ
jgi:hypothetical protein